MSERFPTPAQFPEYGTVPGKKEEGQERENLRSPGGQTFRDDLARNMKSIPDHKERSEALTSEQATWRYRKAEAMHQARNKAETDEKEVIAKIGSKNIGGAKNIPDAPELHAAIKAWADTASDFYFENQGDEENVTSPMKDRARASLKTVLNGLGYSEVRFENMSSMDSLSFTKPGKERWEDRAEAGEVTLDPDPSDPDRDRRRGRRSGGY